MDSRLLLLRLSTLRRNGCVLRLGGALFGLPGAAGGRLIRSSFFLRRSCHHRRRSLLDRFSRFLRLRIRVRCGRFCCRGLGRLCGGGLRVTGHQILHLTKWPLQLPVSHRQSNHQHQGTGYRQGAPAARTLLFPGALREGDNLSLLRSGFRLLPELLLHRGRVHRHLVVTCAGADLLPHRVHAQTFGKRWAGNGAKRLPEILFLLAQLLLLLCGKGLFFHWAVAQILFLCQRCFPPSK